MTIQLPENDAPPSDASAKPHVTVGGLTKEALGSFNLERGVLRTAIDLTVRPNVVIRRYLELQKESGYTSVWSYFLLTTGAMVLIENIFPRHAVPTPIDDISPILVRYRAAWLALSLPLNAAATLLLFRRWQFTYAEHLIIAGFVTAQVQIFWLVIHPMAVLGSTIAGRVAALIGLLAVFLYPAAVVLRLDQQGARGRLVRSLLVALFYQLGQLIALGIAMTLLMLLR